MPTGWLGEREARQEFRELAWVAFHVGSYGYHRSIYAEWRGSGYLLSQHRRLAVQARGLVRLRRLDVTGQRLRSHSAVGCQDRLSFPGWVQPIYVRVPEAVVRSRVSSFL